MEKRDASCACSAVGVTRDYSAAIAAAGQLYGESWFVDRTQESVTAFSGDLAAELAPGEQVSLALAVMIAKKAAYPGLLVVVPGSRFLVCWREESQTFTEYYELNSVPAQTSTATVPGVDGTADLLVLTDRRIVVPSAEIAEHLRIAFMTPPALPGRTDAPTDVMPAQGPSPTTGPPDAVTATSPMPAVQSSAAPTLPPTSPPPATGPVQAPLSGAQGGRSSGRVALIIVAAVVAGVLLLGGAAYGIYRVTQNYAGQPATGADPAGSPSAEVTDEPSQDQPSQDEPSEPGATLPQASEPLSDDTLVIRRNDSGDWKIETVTVEGRTGSVLASGQQNRAVVLTRDRRTVLYLRVAGDSSTLRAVAADGSDGWALFSDGTSECPKLAQPAISADNVLAVACAGSLNLMNLDGSLIRVLDSGRVGDPTFTRDGSAIIYWKASGSGGDGGALYRVPVDGSEKPTLLAAADDGAFDDPACSPTEDVVAASRLRGDERRIVTLSTTGDPADVTTLSPERTAATGPAWSPDGSQIAYRVGTGNDSSLAVMNSDGSSVEKILPAQQQLANPVWTAH